MTQLTFLRVKVSCLLPTAVSATLLVQEFSSDFRRSSREALREEGVYEFIRHNGTHRLDFTDYAGQI